MKGQVNSRRVLMIIDLFMALSYRRAALRDERDGLPFTAAMEWRKAAEFASGITLLANQYWREWERLMQLPRRLAEPFGLAAAGLNAAVQQNSPSFQNLHCELSFSLEATLRPAA